ncbi:MAG TPA: glutamine amidotransferase, partial [Myxococcota bacterium]
RAKFTFTPQRAGKRLYTVQAPVLDGEAIAENNRLDFTVKLIRDRIRVLQVAGRPSWDERFVRRLLKENPSVDLISFFILRSTTDISGANNNELSLIPFPTRELFTEQLSTFDVVIFQDFNYRPYNMGVYLQNVADYVKGGGGFLMMGGDLGFSEGDYEGTPLAEVLPVTLRPGHGHLDTEDFTPVLTDVGRRHPITDVAGMVASTTNPFAQLPPLQGVNLVAGLAPGATALLTHPFANGDDGRPQPVISVRDVEKGRSVAVTTDTTWHWSLPQVGLGGGRGDAHRKLLANTLRWLIRDPELSRVKLGIDADARGIEPGATVTAIVRAQDALYQAEAGAAVKLSLIPLDADARGDGTPPAAIDPLTTGADGSARASLHPDRPGAWKVKVEVDKDGQLVGVDEDVFVVRTASLERLHAEARPDLLRSLAVASGGRAVDVDNVTGLPFVDHARVRVHRQKTEPLWNTATALLVIVGLAAVEWWWRRRRGFA